VFAIVKLTVKAKPKPLKIITTSLPDGEVSKDYECQIEAEGGVPPYNWLCSALPDGLMFNNQTARITGIPLHSATSTFDIIVRDSSQSSSTMEYTLDITTPPAPPVKVVIMSPKGGEVFYEGDTEDITWVAENAGDETLDIHLILDGVMWIIATDIPVKSLGHLWTIAGIPASENAAIMLLTNYQTVQCPPFAIRERSGCVPWPLAKALKKVRKLVTQLKNVLVQAGFKEKNKSQSSKDHRVYRRVGYMNEDACYLSPGVKYMHFRLPGKHWLSCGTCTDDSPPIECLKKDTKIIVYERNRQPDGNAEAFRVRLAKH
jgi:hypothetical protein